MDPVSFRFIEELADSLDIMKGASPPQEEPLEKRIVWNEERCSFSISGEEFIDKFGRICLRQSVYVAASKIDDLKSDYNNKFTYLLQEVIAGFPGKDVLGLIDAIILLNKISKVFHHVIHCMLLGSMEEPKKEALNKSENVLFDTIQDTLKVLSQGILNQHELPLFDHHQQCILSIPGETYFNIVSLIYSNTELSCLDFLLYFSKMKREKMLFSITQNDYEAGVKWLGEYREGRGIQFISVENFHSLIRFASIFKMQVLVNEINTFAKGHSDLLVSHPIDYQDFYQQIHLAFEHNLPDLKQVCVQRFICCLHDLEAEQFVARLIVFIEQYHLNDFLFGEEGLFPPISINISKENERESFHFGKLFYLSGRFRTLVRNWGTIFSSNPYPLLTLTDYSSKELLLTFVTMIHDGDNHLFINRDNCIDLFLLANKLEAPLLYEKSLDLLVDQMMNFVLTFESQSLFRSLFGDVLPYLPIHLKPAIEEKAFKLCKSYLPLNSITIDELNVWIDFSLACPLLNLQKWLIQLFEGEIGNFGKNGLVLSRINNAMEEKANIVQWPKNLKLLPPMKVEINHKDQLKWITVEKLEGLNPNHLDLSGMEINGEGLNKLVELFPNLTKLTLSSSKLFDEDLLILSTLSKLYSLSLHQCSNITKNGCLALLEKRRFFSNFNYLLLRFGDESVRERALWWLVPKEKLNIELLFSDAIKIGCRWLEEQLKGQGKAYISSKNIDPLIRFLAHSEKKELKDQINCFIEKNSEQFSFHHENELNLERMYLYAKVAIEQNLPCLRRICIEYLKKYLSFSQEIARLIAFSERQQLKQQPDFLFSEKGVFPPVVQEGKRIHFGKFLCLSRTFQTMVHDLDWDGSPIPFNFSIPEVLIQILNEGSINKITKKNCISLFLLADKLDISFVQEACLDHLLVIIPNYVLRSNSAQNYRTMLKDILPRFPLHLKSVAEACIVKKVKAYFCSLEEAIFNKNGWNDWIDLALTLNLEEMQKILIRLFEGEIGKSTTTLVFDRIGKAIDAKQHVVWPKGLKRLPPMHVESPHIPLINIEALKELNPKYLDLTGMKIDDLKVKNLIKWFPNLNELKLPCQSLINEDLLGLSTLPLYKLELIDCTDQITEEGCVALLMKRQSAGKPYLFLTLNGVRIKTPIPWSSLYGEWKIVNYNR